MKLFDPKFKYVARDCRGKVRVYTKKPVLGESCWHTLSFYGRLGISGVSEEYRSLPWRESLREILPNGTLIVPISYEHDEVILVKEKGQGVWKPRHFKGVDERGRVVTYKDGSSSKTSSCPEEGISWGEHKPYDEEEAYN